MSVDFISETMAVRRKWHIVKELKEHNCQLRLLYFMISFRNEGEIKTLSDEGN